MELHSAWKRIWQQGTMYNRRMCSKILEMYAKLNTQPTCVQLRTSLHIELGYWARLSLNCLNARQYIKCAPPVHLSPQL